MPKCKECEYSKKSDYCYEWMRACGHPEGGRLYVHENFAFCEKHTPKINPCPFCNSVVVNFVPDGPACLKCRPNVAYFGHAHCKICGSYGPRASSRKAAILLWNKAPRARGEEDA